MSSSSALPRLVPLVPRLLGLTAIRLGLAAAALAAAFEAGADRSSGLAGFAFGAGVSAVMLVADRRSLLLGEPTVEPLPEAVEWETWPRYVAAGLFPSTVGVTVLAAVSLAKPVLTAVLAGVLAGMAVAGSISIVRLAIWERRDGLRLVGQSGKGRRLFFGPRA